MKNSKKLKTGDIVRDSRFPNYRIGIIQDVFDDKVVVGFKAVVNLIYNTKRIKFLVKE